MSFRQALYWVEHDETRHDWQVAPNVPPWHSAVHEAVHAPWHMQMARFWRITCEAVQGGDVAVPLRISEHVEQAVVPPPAPPAPVLLLLLLTVTLVDGSGGMKLPGPPLPPLRLLCSRLMSSTSAPTKSTVVVHEYASGQRSEPVHF